MDEGSQTPVIGASETDNSLSLKTKLISSHLVQAEVTVAASLFECILGQTLRLYQKNVIQPGFKPYRVPLNYIKQHYQREVYTNVKGFLFTHLVFNYLLKQLCKQKVIMANTPRLKRVDFTEQGDACYIFNVSVAEHIKLKEWKHFVFKSPKRKNYKDLDKQVALFVKRERSLYKKQEHDIIQEGDWVLFQAILLDDDLKEVKPLFSTSFWVKMTVQHITLPICAQLLNQKIGHTFVTNDLALEEAFQEHLNKKYTYRVTIMSILKGGHLSLESFKTTFKLKSKASIHKKLIEVFSYRNDISQRRSIIEEIFHLFFSKHRFEIPKHITLRRKEEILFSLKQQSDYRVYKNQKGFIANVELLAEKQLKEEILMDQIAYSENLEVSDKDVQNYLNFFNNERLREFVYFKPIIDKIEDSSTPIYPGILYQATLREKALNYVIHLLTR